MPYAARASCILTHLEQSRQRDSISLIFDSRPTDRLFSYMLQQISQVDGSGPLQSHLFDIQQRASTSVALYQYGMLHVEVVSGGMVGTNFPSSSLRPN
jgi:hypothetical protein